MALPPKKTLPQLVREALARENAYALVERVAGKWTPASSAAVLARVENVAAAIRKAGLVEGDRVALISHDCVDWVVCAFATLFAGCVVVPIYPTQALDQTGYILGHSGAKLLFLDTAQALARLGSIPSLPRAVVFEGQGDGSLTAFEAHGAHSPRATTSAAPDDLAVLIYTSGTTGNPKGVMLTHDNVGFDAQSALAYGFQGIHAGQEILSVLPYSHIFEHTMIYIYMLARVRYFICHDPNAMLPDVQDVRPFSMTAVPRIFDRVLAGVTASAMAQGGLAAKLVPWALRAGHDYMYAKTFKRWAGPRRWLAYLAARALVLKAVRKRLGLDRLRYFTSGSAALHVDTAMTFLGLGLPIMQGYGLTETSPVTTVSRLSANRYGAVGKPIPGVEVKIADDGEILTRGRHVMKGYYRDEAATAEAIQNGWLQTGDVGQMEKGFVYITDRKRELFKTAGGKFIAPARVESAIRRSLYVTQAMVVGEGQPHPAAVINANWDLVRKALGISADVPPERLAARDDVLTFLTAEIEKQTADLATFEQIRRIVVIPQEFTVESGYLSPAMKIKRRVVEQHYADEIDRAYRTELRLHAHA
ncbi:MAG TPA: long-chain fatty acid--CoA ligase [Candidatus Dormibacteraeota bacterium]|nr:long-chain fatty acid--CoA ligase [Candidatus Dormibacteraeota bacterium]